MSNTYENFLSPYACLPRATKGRLYPESEHSSRSCFQRDRDRIIHSGAFRKLEYKTQVFINYDSDYYRTRLTHSLEVAQISRSLCRRLALNEDLAEAISLAHDLGHTPFGHAGEEALNNCPSNCSKFDHNMQSLRILIELEKKYTQFNGLNLTWETIEGIAKHNGPILNPSNKLLLKYNEIYKLDLDKYPSAEAQISAISDDIAYNAHDLDDGLRANFFVIEELFDLPIIGKIFKQLKESYPKSHKSIIMHEGLRKIINVMIDDVVEQAISNIKIHNIKCIDDIKNLNKSLVHFSPEIQECTQKLKSFLKKRVYRHYKVNRITSKTKRIIIDLFEFFYREPFTLPTEWGESILDINNNELKSLIICDFIAGMTDRFAIQEHRRIFDTSYEMCNF